MGFDLAGIDHQRRQIRQRELLLQTLTESAAIREIMDDLISAWRSGDIDYLEKTLLDDVAGSSSNPVLAATAKANLASALADAGELERSESTWRELAAAPSAYFPKDMALLGLGKLLIDQGREGEARGVLQEVVDDFPQTSSMVEAQALLDRI